MLIEATVKYISALPSWSSQLIAVDEKYQWAQGWTITYLIWWIAWTPFVGLFIARISRGRSIREYLIAVIFVPTIVSMIWFSLFGGGALAFDQQNQGVLTELLAGSYTEPLFAWLSNLPFGAALKIAAAILLFIFLITSADSAAYVLGILGENGKAKPSRFARLSWGLVIVVIAGALLLRNNVDINKAVAIVGAIPFTLVLWLYAIVLLTQLWRDLRKLPPEETYESTLGDDRN